MQEKSAVKKRVAIKSAFQIKINVSDLTVPPPESQQMLIAFPAAVMLISFAFQS